MRGRRGEKRKATRRLRTGLISTSRPWKGTRRFSSGNRFSLHLKRKQSMRIVTYSLSANDPSHTTDYHEQLCQSVKSLRTYNKLVPVHVFLYGEHPRIVFTELERQAVIVHQMGSYLDAVRRLRPRAFRTLVRYPVLHKWMNFHKVAALS